MSVDYSKPIFIHDRFDRVELWFHSPSGDSSDSVVLQMPCASSRQAQFVAEQWAIRFDMTYTNAMGQRVVPSVVV